MNISELTDQPKKASLVVSNSPGLQTQETVEALLAAARSKRGEAPLKAAELSRLARGVAQKLTAKTLEVECMAEEGNALRLTGDIGRGYKLLQHAWKKAQEYKVDDTLVGAGVLLKLASALEYLDRYERMEEAALESLRVSRICDDAQAADQVGALIVASNARCWLGRFRDAKESACVAFEVAETLRQKVWCSHVLAHIYVEYASMLPSRRVKKFKAYDTAIRLLSGASWAYEKVMSPVDLAQRHWMEGRVARGVREYRHALDLFERALCFHRSAERTVDSAILILDRALTLSMMGRTRQARVEAQTAATLLQDLNQRREGQAARLLTANLSTLETLRESCMEALVILRARRRPAF